MTVTIDPNSGFCGGVIRAIGKAEEYLSEHGGRLYSLGAMVHNGEELARLESLGLKSVSIDELETIEHRDGEPLVIRAHGVPPQVYGYAEKLGYSVMDCTCPVVIKLQAAIREAYSRMTRCGGRVVIYGKAGHPEVLGLVGQVGGDVSVVQTLQETVEMVESGRLAVDRQVELFSQTTMNPDGYAKVQEYLRSHMEEGLLEVHTTICRQVSSRYRDLAEFARAHDAVVFVSGSESSNGKVLYELCRMQNPRSFLIGSAEDLKAEWFSSGDKVGVCGATSTPKWLLERVARAMENLH